MLFVVHAELVERDKLANFFQEVSRLPRLGAKEIEKVADAGRRGISDNFAREQEPNGTPWHPLARFTQEQRAKGIDERGVPFRVGRAHPILVRTKDLRLSFTDPRHPRNITLDSFRGGVLRLTLGAEDDPQTPDRIKTLHAGGLTPEGRKVPARPFIGWSPEAVERIDRTARFVLNERVRRLP